MADLRGLIRLRKHELDEKRRVLGELNEKMILLEQNKQHFLDQLEEEKQKAAENPSEVHPTLGEYIKSVNTKCTMLDHMMEQLDEEIEQAKEIVREAFSELKKYEMTQEKRDAEAQAELDSKETAEMDAIGLENYRRQNEET